MKVPGCGLRRKGVERKWILSALCVYQTCPDLSVFKEALIAPHGGVLPSSRGAAAGVVFISLILTSLFGSFLQPLAIMLALPLSFLGVGIGLWMTGGNLNVMSMIGIIMLMGLVTKNGILLIDCEPAARGGSAAPAGDPDRRPRAPAADRNDDGGDGLGMVPLAIALARAPSSARRWPTP